jgi:hypothetical protein
MSSVLYSMLRVGVGNDIFRHPDMI